MRKLFKTLLKLILVLVLTLVLAEMGVRLFFSPEDEAQLQVVEIVRTNRYFSDTLDATRAYPYLLNRIETDKHTELVLKVPTRKPQRIFFAKPQDTYRVVVVGDSVTEIWPLPHYKNFTDFLAQNLRELMPHKQVEVLALGVGGYNHWAEMHFFRDHFLELEADLLILQHCPNDFEYLVVTSKEPQFIVTRPDFQCPHFPAQGVPVKPDGSAEMRRYRWPNARLYGITCMQVRYDHARFLGLNSQLLWLLDRRMHAKSNFLRGQAPVESNPQLRTALRWFRQHAKSKHMDFAVVVFPFFVEGRAKVYNDLLGKILNEESIDYLMLGPLLPDDEEVWAAYFQDVAHPTEKGHEFFGQVISDYLKQHYLPQYLDPDLKPGDVTHE